MAANKFATMVNNNTNKITLVLIYAVLEWTLILLLLLNSIFSYFIIKFAKFFGLKPPCLWCVHLEDENSHRDLLCERHVKEVTRLGFCEKHGKLAEFRGMCENCADGFAENWKNLGVSEVENGDFVKCSCCESSYFVVNRCLDFLGFSKKGDSIVNLIESNLENDDFGEKQQEKTDEKTDEKTEEKTEIESIKDDLIQFEKMEISNSEKNSQDLEFFLDFSGTHLVPIELIEPNIEQFQTNSEDEEQEFGDFQESRLISESKPETVTEELLTETTQETVSVLKNVAEESLSVTEKTEELSKFAELDSMEFEETENSLLFHANLSTFHGEKPVIFEPNGIHSKNEELQETEESDSGNEEGDISIGTEIPVLDSFDEIKARDNFTSFSLSHEEPSTSSHDSDFNLECGFEEPREHEKTGELTGDECFDPINTTEKLKSALRAKGAALEALYIELEEERNASAVAASETMAMINRLQEEKAAMQMEALHYQRMMEEQSEYDQEALRLLNDLMIKREKEMEMYRKRVLEYETKERIRVSTSSGKCGTCSASCSHSEDGDGTWVDLGHEPKESQRHLDSSFVDFEDERLSILDQLRVLEEKLFTLSDEEDRFFGEVKPIEDYFEENGIHLNGSYGYAGYEINNVTNGFQTGKRLLPLFDALETESDDGGVTSNGHENGFHPDKFEDNAVTRFELQKKRIDMEEEVDQLYVRLQALEADREFLKHCIGSLKKGEKGMELLKEILQHLRELRSVDLRAKSFTEGTLHGENGALA